MDHFTSPFLHLVSKHKIEFLILSTALVTTFISLAIYYDSKQFMEGSNVVVESVNGSTFDKLFVDLSGAVEVPDVYEVSSGARLRDILLLGGGLSANADRVFFARNFNLARQLFDQEKIYIPSEHEVEQGVFVQSTQKDILGSQNSKKININSAILSELDTLPGIGKVTAQKIIDGRPYDSIDELVVKKIVNKSVFEKTKDLIEP